MRKIKAKDYIYLARESVKSRKKSSRNTVRGIAFGLILLLPVLFFSMAYYMDYTKSINEKESVYCFRMNTLNVANESPDLVDNFGSSALFNYNILNELNKTEEVSHKIVSEMVIFEPDNPYLDTGIYVQSGENETQRLTTNFDNEYRRTFNKLRILHYDLSDGKLYPDGSATDMRQKYDAEILKAGNSFSSQTKGKEEVIISEYLSDFLGYQTAEQAVGKSFNLKTVSVASQNLYGYVDNDSIPNNLIPEGFFNEEILDIKLCQGYTIVGVIDKNYYKLLNMEYDGDIIISDASVYDEEGNSYKPVISQLEQSENSLMTVYTYPTSIIDYSNQAIGEGLFFLGYGYGITPSSSLYGMALDSDMTVLLQMKSFKGATKCATIIDNRIEDIRKLKKLDYLYVNYSNNVYENLQMINKISTVVITIFVIFGGIILLATLINLFNTIQYSVESRKNYIGMLRAIGTKNNGIRLLYFTEMLIIFVKALIRTIIVGGALCVLIKFGFDYAFAHIGEYLGLSFQLSLIYLPIVMIGIMVSSMIISLLFAIISCAPVCNRPILNNLKEDM